MIFPYQNSWSPVLLDIAHLFGFGNSPEGARPGAGVPGSSLRLGQPTLNGKYRGILS
jgi:hypothetical protein